MRVGRIDVDRADDPAGIVRRRRGSSRVQTTDAAGAFALSVMNTRPVLVAAHIVPVFCGARSIQATAPPAPARPADVGRRQLEVGRAAGADPDEVTAAGLRGGRRELGAVGFEVRLVAAPVLRPPDARTSPGRSSRADGRVAGRR